MIDPEYINVPAIIVAAVLPFILGGLWYSPLLFGKAWMNVNNFTREEIENSNQIKKFVLSFIFFLLMSANLAGFLASPETDLSFGILAGFLAGFGWVALSFGVIALFEMRSWKYIFINGGYMVVAFVLMGAVLGAWR
jgi:asparagine N-glycosylation enzyme membrane subunit Stt3